MNIEVKVIEIINEDAYANASNVGGMGNITAAQPSTFAGSTIGSDFTNGGGTIGSGDISGGWFNKPYQKSPAGVSRRKKKKTNKSKVFNQKQDWTHGNAKIPKLSSFADFKFKK